MARRKAEFETAAPTGGSLKSLGVAATGAGGAVLAAAATACCVPVLAPLLVSLLGVSGAVWAAGLQPYSPLILAASGLVLGFGFRSLYRKRDTAAGEICATTRPRLPRLVLWIAATLWFFALALNMLQLLARRL